MTHRSQTEARELRVDHYDWIEWSEGSKRQPPLPTLLRLAATARLAVIVIGEIRVVRDAAHRLFCHSDADHLRNLLVDVGTGWSQVVLNAQTVSVSQAVCQKVQSSESCLK